MPLILKALAYLAIATVSSILSIFIIALIAAAIGGGKSPNYYFYISLQLLMRWFRTLIIGNTLFAGCAYFFDRRSFPLWSFSLLAGVVALLMVGLRESQTIFRFGFFSWEYFDDVLRNSVLFISYVFLVPILLTFWLKRKERSSSLTANDVLDDL